MFTRYLFFKFFLFVLIASIITFSKKQFCGKRNVTLDPRPSTLDPRQKDRLRSTDAAYVQPPRSLIQNRLLRRGTDPRPDFFLGEGVPTEAGAHQLKEK